MGSGTLLCPTPAAQRPSGAGRGESRSWADLGEGGALEVRGSIGNSQCTRALGRCERHAPERLGRRGAGCGTSPSKARATDAVVTGLCRGYPHTRDKIPALCRKTQRAAPEPLALNLPSPPRRGPSALANRPFCGFTFVSRNQLKRCPVFTKIVQPSLLKGW